ncbi:GAF domain-containing protein [Wenzhouxiangella sp. AB-CW3]|uniref:GAF domain-containing protein n=1 Tax=Wenzhouxiangella sp. AB-CW3 TaxID=2771012 RepID=UPI00168BC381|nr:GAF domain-containing protein [Wenzhouxiangella sp. AB-CW3]QOC23172.1 GAF domain-containing protein [Wenzhouxiangella sp. AB-CW3]
MSPPHARPGGVQKRFAPGICPCQYGAEDQAHVSLPCQGAGNCLQFSKLAGQAARKIARADGATFVLRDGDLCHYVEENAVSPLWRGKRFPISQCVSGWVMLNRQPAVIADIHKDDRVPTEAYSTTFVRSMAMVPIRSRDPIGAIGFYWADHHAASELELRLFTILADAVSLALERLRVLEDLARVESELQPETTPEKTLDKMVRMCSWTGRLDIDGQWISMEDFLQKNFGIRVTHAISPEGARHLGCPTDSSVDKSSS